MTPGPWLCAECGLRRPEWFPWSEDVTYGRCDECGRSEAIRTWVEYAPPREGTA